MKNVLRYLQFMASPAFSTVWKYYVMWKRSREYSMRILDVLSKIYRYAWLTKRSGDNKAMVWWNIYLINKQFGTVGQSFFKCFIPLKTFNITEGLPILKLRAHQWLFVFAFKGQSSVCKLKLREAMVCHCLAMTVRWTQPYNLIRILSFSFVRTPYITLLAKSN